MGSPFSDHSPAVTQRPPSFRGAALLGAIVIVSAGPIVGVILYLVRWIMTGNAAHVLSALGLLTLSTLMGGCAGAVFALVARARPLTYWWQHVSYMAAMQAYLTIGSISMVCAVFLAPHAVADLPADRPWFYLLLHGYGAALVTLVMGLMGLFRGRTKVLSLKPFLWFLLVLGVLAGFLLPAIPPNEGYVSELHYCARCGVRSYTLETWSGTCSLLVVEEGPELYPTKLSLWYEKHYQTPCQHDWRFNDSSSGGYFVVGPFRMSAGAQESGSSPTPSIVYLPAADEAELEERFRKNPEDCRRFIHERLDPRRNK